MEFLQEDEADRSRAHVMLNRRIALHLYLFVLAILLGRSDRVGAEELFPFPEDAYSNQATAMSAESKILLQNGSVLSGKLNRLGDTAIIERADGTRITIATTHVAFVGQTMEELYRHRVSGRRALDLFALQNDVRWCLRHGLLKQAAIDVLHARKLEPSDVQTQQLVRQVASRMRAEAAPLETPQPDSIPPVTNPQVDPTAPGRNQPQPIQQVAHTEPISSPGDSLSKAEVQIDSATARLDEVSVARFKTKIQTMLTNRCANCHTRSSDNQREFQIHSAVDAKFASTRVANENLAEVLKYIDWADPMSSEFRTRVTDGHGGRRNRFGNPNSAMMQILDSWLKGLHREDTGFALPLADRQEPSGVSAPGNAVPTTADSQAPATVPDFPDPVWPMSEIEDQFSTNEIKSLPRRMPEVKNPFDPQIFNRRVHGR